MSLEDDVQALSNCLDGLQELIPRLVEALDNLAGVIEAEASDRAGDGSTPSTDDGTMVVDGMVVPWDGHGVQ